MATNGNSNGNGHNGSGGNGKGANGLSKLKAESSIAVMAKLAPASDSIPCPDEAARRWTT